MKLWEEGMTVWKLQLRDVKKETAGTTLVELIVTFALIGIFMTAASFMLSSGLNLFSRMQATASAVTVSDLLLDKIAGEIAAAREPQMDTNDEAIQGYYFWMDADKDAEWITMWNRSGSPLAIYAEPVDSENPEKGKALCLKYYETVRGDANASRSGTAATIPEVNWHFDESVYMGYRITEDGLTFTREDPENHPNVIRIDLEIRNERTGFTYQASRYAESYNYEFKLAQVHKYMGVRNDGGMPVTAEEFMIRGSSAGDEGGGGEVPEPEKPVVAYYVRHYIDGKLELSEEMTAVEGSSFILYPKDNSVPGFENCRPISEPISVTIERAAEYEFRYETIRQGEYPYQIRCHVNEAYMADYAVGGETTGYRGTAYRSKWELYRETRYADLEDNGSFGIPPTVEGYEPVLGTYTITVSNTHTVLIDIPYKPVDVKVIIHSRCGNQILDKTELIGRYESTIDLSNSKKIDGYTCSQTFAKIPVFQLSDVEYTFFYAKDGAPFRPTGEKPDVMISPQPSQEMLQSQQNLAWEFTDFFMNDWSVMKNPRIGYRTFEYEGETYAIAGYCDLNNSHSISSDAKDIEKATGVPKENHIYLTDVNGGFKNSGDSEILWKYLISQTDNLTVQEKEFLNEASERRLQFTERWVNEEKYYYLKQIEYTLSTSPQTQVIISYKSN